MKKWHVNLCSPFTINLKTNTEIFAYPGSQDFHSTRRWLHLLFVCFSQQLWYQLWFESNLVQFSDKLKNLSPGWVRILVLSSGKIKWLWHTVCHIPNIPNFTISLYSQPYGNIAVGVFVQQFKDSAPVFVVDGSF